MEKDDLILVCEKYNIVEAYDTSLNDAFKNCREMIISFPKASIPNYSFFLNKSSSSPAAIAN